MLKFNKCTVDPKNYSFWKLIEEYNNNNNNKKDKKLTTNWICFVILVEKKMSKRALAKKKYTHTHEYSEVIELQINKRK